MARLGVDTTAVTPSRASVVALDNGAQGGHTALTALFSLLQLPDFLNQLMTALDVIEPVAASTTSYAVVSGDQNKTKLCQNTGTCTVNLPAGMPPGFLVDFIAAGSGNLLFQSAAGASQTIVAPRGARSGGVPGVRVTVEVTQVNTWNVSGDTQT